MSSRTRPLKSTANDHKLAIAIVPAVFALVGTVVTVAWNRDGSDKPATSASAAVFEPLLVTAGPDLQFSEEYVIAFEGSLPEQQGFPAEQSQIKPWMYTRGGIDAGTNNLAIYLTNRGPTPLEIIDIRPSVISRDPVVHGAYAYVPGGGSVDAVVLKASVDQSDRPQPVQISETGEVDDKPFFQTHTISLAPGEVQLVTLAVDAADCLCAFEVEIKSLREGQVVTTSIRSATTKPFFVTGYAGQGGYDSYWIYGEAECGESSMVPYDIATGYAVCP